MHACASRREGYHVTSLDVQRSSPPRLAVQGGLVFGLGQSTRIHIPADTADATNYSAVQKLFDLNRIEN